MEIREQENSAMEIRDQSRKIIGNKKQQGSMMKYLWEQGHKGKTSKWIRDTDLPPGPPHSGAIVLPVSHKVRPSFYACDSSLVM